LSRDVQVTGAAWWAAMRIVAGVGDLVQRIDDDRTGRVLGDWTIGRSGDAVCGLHRARRDEEHGFLEGASKSRSTDYHWFGLKITGMLFQWFGIKNTGMVFSGLYSKSVATVFSGLASKSVVSVSPGLTLKPVVGFLVELQNQVWFGPQNRQLRFDDLGLKITTIISWFDPQN
jgi:hypothetical protein